MKDLNLQRFADGLPEAVILLDDDGQILFINKPGRRFLKNRFNTIDDKTHLADFLENSREELSRIIVTWSRTREPVPAVIRWRNEKAYISRQRWSYQGFMLEPASPDISPILVLRCMPGRGKLSEFALLNDQLEQTRLAMTKLQQTRDELSRLYEQASVTLSSIGDGVISTDIDGNIRSLNPVAEYLTGWTEQEAIGKPSDEVFHIVEEISRDPIPSPVLEAIRHAQIIQLSKHTILISRKGREYVIEDSVAPIIGYEGDLLGAVLVFHDVTNDRLARRQLEYLAQHDMLTSLHNRHYFEQEISSAVELARRDKFRSAIFYIDLDEFKSVNDTAGHSIGDSLLTQIAELFSTRLRSGDVLARLGGDEFGILVRNINENEIPTIAKSYQDALDNFRFTWEERQFNIHASIGVAYINKHTSTVAEAFRQADVACYVAKQAGKNRFHVYDAENDTKSRQLGEIDLLSKLHDAIKHDGFQLLYQPIVATKGKSHEYYEVLLRLTDKEQMLVPSMFIPIAERHGLMSKIDHWVIDHTLTMIQNGKCKNCLFAINLSATSLDDIDLIEYMDAKLQDDPDLTRYFMFEITETAAVTHIEKAAEFVRRYRKKGVRFALDDFGTGFSSFAYLKHLPIDIVKIDGLFVRDILVDSSDLAMVRSINHIAQSLGKHTIAEYVESAEIQQLLTDIGIDYLQGYHIGKPAALPASDDKVLQSSA